MGEMNNRVEMPDPKQTQIQPNYQFSREETRVLSECNRESFYQRSVPFSGVLGFATYYGVKSGYLKGSLRFGAIPKVTGAVFVGYFLGKISYQQKCAEKLMQLPDSYIGALLRKKKNKEPLSPGSSLSLFGATSPDVYSDAGPSSSLDIDTDRPTFSGLEENRKPSLDSGGSEQLLVPKSPGMSYEELRKRNREEQNVAQTQPYKLDEPVPPISRARPEQPVRNQYGDIIN